MCGICGVSMSHSEEMDINLLAKDMLKGIESRGRDATGLAWSGANDQIWISKSNIPASTFITQTNVPSDVRTLIGHTRWATKGSPLNNDNNHPIDANGIVGIHNGCVSNDDRLFRDLLGVDTRIGEVDSEAIFALLGNTDILTAEALKMIEGSAAVAWFETSAPDVLHLARVSWSPLIIGRTERGSLLFASTKDCIVNSAKKQGVTVFDIEEIAEGQYLKIIAGEIISRETFASEAPAQSTVWDDEDYSRPSQLAEVRESARSLTGYAYSFDPENWESN